MTLFKKQNVDVYTNQNKVLKTVRLDIESAKKMDELQAVCSTHCKKQITQRELYLAIIKEYLEKIESLIAVDENKAVNTVLKLIGENKK